jgi:hypothetical protein
MKTKDIKVVLVYMQYDNVKYEHAFERIKAQMFLANIKPEFTIIVDNKKESNYVGRLQYEYSTRTNSVVIGNNNVGWEFGAFDKGLQYLKDYDIDYDVVLFCNDSWENPGAGGGIELVLNTDNVTKCYEENKFIANTVCQPDTVYTLNKIDVSTWCRSHCFMLSKSMLEGLGNRICTYDKSFIDKCINKEISRPYFKYDAPMSDTLKNLVTSWLSGFWHTAFVLDDNWELFRMKSLAFFNEITLSARTRELEKNLYYKIDNSDIVILDVFDTCMFRKFKHPWEVFYLNGMQYNGDRQEAERKALAKDVNASIHDIQAEGNFTNEKIQSEIDLEKAVCYQNAEIHHAYKYALEKEKKIVEITKFQEQTTPQSEEYFRGMTNGM